MKHVRLIALDMDGTLLLSDHQTVPQRNIDGDSPGECGGNSCVYLYRPHA